MTTTNTYTTDSQGGYLLTSVSNSAVQGCGSTTNSMVWDANDNLSKTVDNDGVAHTYAYAANGQLQTETEAVGTAVARTTHYGWDPHAQLNRLLSVTVPGESEVGYTYSAQNRLASVTRTNLTGIGTPNQSLVTAYAYTLYGDGMVKTMTATQPSPNGTDHVTYAYDTHGDPSSVTDGLGHVTTFSNYNMLGEVGKVVGPNGAETDYSYDARGRVASKTTHPNGTAATWTYAYDGFGLLAEVSAPDGEVTAWSRDAEKRVRTITHNDKDGASTETFTYDAAGNVASDVIARGGDVGKSTSYIYNALGKIYQVKESHGQALTYGYDGNGNVLSVTNALGYTTHYAYDALNRLVSVTDATGGVTSYSYDADNHIVRVIDPRGLQTSYAWDGVNQVWQVQSPDTGVTQYGHDAYGRLSSLTRADGIQAGFAYDALNRLISETAAGVTRTYTWDACSNGSGRLCTAATGSDSVDYSYTPEGWIAARAFAFTNGPVYDIGYGYDSMGHLAELVYPDGNEVLYDYDRGVVADVRLKVGGNVVNGVTGISYRPMDLAMSGWTSYNGLSNTVGYDSDLRPTSIVTPGVESLALAYDAANRITQVGNGENSSYTQTLGYDALNRLTGVSSGVETASYSYDADGNRTYQDYDGTATSFSYATGSNRLVGTSGGAGMATSYGYNADGNTTTVGGQAAYTYGPFNGLVNADGAAFAISAEGERLSKSYGGTVTYFARGVGGELLTDGVDGRWREYVWLNGRMVAMIKAGGVYSLHDDQTGRTLAITDPGSQAIDWEAKGLAFDRDTVVGSSTFFRLGFPGQYWDAEDDLWHNGARDYDPWLGRYIESDPLGLMGGGNTYAYVDNNPISNVDPLGLCDQKKCAAASAVVAALGRTLTSAGSTVTWTGIGLTGASVLGAIFAPEGAELEADGGANGISMIVAGNRLSATGAVLIGYGRDGLAGAVENGVASLVLDRIAEGATTMTLPEGTGSAITKAVQGVFGEINGAVLAEQAACVGH